MATYTFTAGSVLASGAVLQTGTAGEALQAGDLIYADAADGYKLKKAQNDDVNKAAVAGICLNGAAVGQPIQYTGGGMEVSVQAGAFAGPGRLLVLSGTAGKCMDAGDLIAGRYVTVIGWSTASNKLRLAIGASGVAYA